SVFAAGASARVITDKQFYRLKDGDVVKNGKLFNADGDEVPVVTKQQAIAVTEAAEAGEVTCKEDIDKVIERVSEGASISRARPRADTGSARGRFSVPGHRVVRQGRVRSIAIHARSFGSLLLRPGSRCLNPAVPES